MGFEEGLGLNPTSIQCLEKGEEEGLARRLRRGKEFGRREINRIFSVGNVFGY